MNTRIIEQRDFAMPFPTDEDSAFKAAFKKLTPKGTPKDLIKTVQSQIFGMTTIVSLHKTG